VEKKVIMDREQFIETLITSRRSLEAATSNPRLQAEAEGGCGVIGMAASVPVAGRHLLQALQQMRNRGNGKGGGAAAVGLDPDFFGIRSEMLANDYLLSIAYLDGSVRSQIESTFIEPTFIVDQVFQIPALPDFRSIPGLDIQPPDVWCYFVRVRPDVQASFRQQHGIADEYSVAVEDEIVYQNTYRLNRKYYAATGDKQAFVLSHGKNLLVLKMVGYGDDVFRYYGLENLLAHIWIGHHRYPTKGKVWHPGGAHPFIGMHEALVHNGDFANYTAISSYLSQRNMHPLFLTDTEVAALEFDLLHRIYGYPLEYVIEAMAPTTERDFTLLPPEKQRLYQLLQTVHMHSSPDGPWFFLIAQSDVRKHAYRLIGITDTSMLRPQVFAMQQGTASIGFAASEKQAIDAALESLAQEDSRFWSRADLYWNARGGSHTDGGAFIFNVHYDESGKATLLCTDKFGRAIVPDPVKRPPNMEGQVDARSKGGASAPTLLLQAEGQVDARSKGGASAPTLLNTTPAPTRSGVISDSELFGQVCEQLPTWDYDDVRDFLNELERTAKNDDERDRAFRVMNLLMDRHYPAGTMKRSFLLDLVNRSFAQLVDRVREAPSQRYVWAGFGSPIPECIDARVTLVLDARGYPPEGNESLARALVTLNQHGFRRIIIANTHGQRFIGSGLGTMSEGLRIDIYGSPGDYLASGIDGVEVIVHGSAQDQLAQIMKGGKLVVYGDVGQTFMYAAKGGEAFILGNAAGRPLINAVGRPRVVINGTCLDYLAESFMAGDPLNGGGFVIVNGVRFDEDGTIRELDTPYPGGNLFSLASGGAIYMRDPLHKVNDDQLNGGEFAPLTARDWALIRPYFEKNESIFGIPLERLLTVDGIRQHPERVYRKIRPAGHKALMPEEAWVRREA
jgi:glutamate synthase domain-containing protein 1/glutamate synthase domain-containing protein 3